jgi:hypothetical protein
MSDLKSPSNGVQVARRRRGRGALVRLTMALGVLSLSGCCIFGPVGGVCVPWGGPGGGGPGGSPGGEGGGHGGGGHGGEWRYQDGGHTRQGGEGGR